MTDARHQQAERAMDFLRIANDVELGTDYNRQRELTKDEKEVKEAALTSLLDYFVSDPETPAADKRTAKRKRAGARARV